MYNKDEIWEVYTVKFRRITSYSTTTSEFEQPMVKTPHRTFSSTLNVYVYVYVRICIVEVAIHENSINQLS